MFYLGDQEYWIATQKTGNETARYYCINFGIVTFGNTLVIINIGLQHRGIDF